MVVGLWGVVKMVVGWCEDAGIGVGVYVEVKCCEDRGVMWGVVVKM